MAIKTILKPSLIKSYLLLILSAECASAHIDVNTFIEMKLGRVKDKLSWNETLSKYHFNSSLAEVEKEEVKIKDKNYTIEIGYREIKTSASKEKILKVLNEPVYFRELYGLDKDTLINDFVGNPDQFFAHIYKKIPILPDQDYILKYETIRLTNFWIQRASTDSKDDFAIRDNVKSIDDLGSERVFREVSFVYPLKWYVRALGPKLRSIMKNELEKLSKSEKCAFESESYNQEVARSCWKKAQE